jgi:hypothetical protein
LTASPLQAALVNGMLAHSDGTDDSARIFPVHLVALVLALAAGEKFGIDGMHSCAPSRSATTSARASP